MRITQHAIYASDAAAHKHLLVPLQQLAAGALRRDLESPIDVLHQHIQQLGAGQCVDGRVHLHRFDRQNDAQDHVQRCVFDRLIFAAQRRVLQGQLQRLDVLALGQQLRDLRLVGPGMRFGAGGGVVLLEVVLVVLVDVDFAERRAGGVLGHCAVFVGGGLRWGAVGGSFDDE